MNFAKRKSSNADMDMTTSGRMHLHPLLEIKKWMDAGGFVATDLDTETGGLALPGDMALSVKKV